METKYVNVESSCVISALVRLYATVQRENEADSTREAAQKLSKALLRLLNKSNSYSASEASDAKYVKVPVLIAEQVFQNAD